MKLGDLQPIDIPDFFVDDPEPNSGKESQDKEDTKENTLNLVEF
jgi:hypothetical protein